MSRRTGESRSGFVASVNREVAISNEILQVEVPGLPGNNAFLWMQLRQSPPDVITDVVVRFVECVFNEILNAQVEYQTLLNRNTFWDFDHKRHKCPAPLAWLTP